MSPPFLDSAPPLSSTLSSPPLISQPPFGNSFSRAPRQPQVLRPSKSSSKPCERSSSVSVLGVRPVAARGSSRIRMFRHLHREPGLLRLVHLEADEARARHAVDDVRDRDAVHPRAQPVAVRLHAVLVPLADLNALREAGASSVLVSQPRRCSS